jgi:hypothetical protein
MSKIGESSLVDHPRAWYARSWKEGGKQNVGWLWCLLPLFLLSHTPLSSLVCHRGTDTGTALGRRVLRHSRPVNPQCRAPGCKDRTLHNRFQEQRSLITDAGHQPNQAPRGRFIHGSEMPSQPGRATSKSKLKASNYADGTNFCQPFAQFVQFDARNQRRVRL